MLASPLSCFTLEAEIIKLYGFGPFLGTPDASPFVIKTMLLLKFAGLPFQGIEGNPFNGPHRFLPYIDDEGEKVPDSSLIRLHLERKYRHDFDAGLNVLEKAVAWSVERMCEDHLYFAMLAERWLDSANFRQGLGRHMFGGLPLALRPLAKIYLTRMNAKRLMGQGLGRHLRSDIIALAARDIEALAALIGGKPYLMGDRPCGADAFVFAIITSIATPPLNTPLRDAMTRHENLIAYRDRITAQYFS